MQETPKPARPAGPSLVGMSIFDVTGLVVYTVMRRWLTAKQHNRSAIEPFRSSAQIVSDAYRDASGTTRR